MEREVDDEDLGLCDFEKLEISIKQDLIPDVYNSVFLHEFFHALFASSGYTPKDEEDVVDVLANNLLLILKDNPDFLNKFIKKEEK